MKKTLLSALFLSIAAIQLNAGGLLTNTNQHIRFNRMFARNGTIGIDGVYSNPAGVAFLPNGLHLSINNQSAFQTRTIWSGMDVKGLDGTPFHRPFTMHGGNSEGIKKFKGEASVPIIPSVQAALNYDKWGFQASFAITGGGGKCTFNHGLASFERTIALLPMALQQFGMGSDTPSYSVDSYLMGRQYVFGLQLGTTYKITPDLAVYGGFRFNYITNKYEGNIRNITANIGGTDENVYDYLGLKGQQISDGIAMLNQAIQMTSDPTQKAVYEQQLQQLTTQQQTVAGARHLVADRYLDCTQTGWSITPVIGIDYRMGKWNFGARYEFTTRCNIENDTKIDDTGLFADGVNTPGDLPGLLSLGAQYEITKRLRAAVGYHYFFDRHTHMANNKQKLLSGNTQEFLAGIEYDITDAIQVSAGGQKTNYGLGDGGYLSDMSFTTSSYSIGFGAGIKVAKNATINIAYFWTTYDKFKKNYDQQISLAGKTLDTHCSDEFTRTNKVFGIGLDIDF